ncbi:hypothetical protein JXA85_03195 [Candidatus Woesearchaeota archaeon]|nr:hypothetical protein [Candidatus Woesearchaeota archaeon]
MEKDIASIKHLIELQEKKVRILTDIQKVWNFRYKKAYRFIDINLKKLTKKQINYLSMVTKDCETLEGFFAFIESTIQQYPEKKLPNEWDNVVHSKNTQKPLKLAFEKLETKGVQKFRGLHKMFLYKLKSVHQDLLADLEYLEKNDEYDVIHKIQFVLERNEKEKKALEKIDDEFKNIDSYLEKFVYDIKSYHGGLKYFEESEKEFKDFLKSQNEEGIRAKVDEERNILLKKIRQFESLEDIKIYLAEESIKKFNSPKNRFFLIAIMMIIEPIIKRQKIMLEGINNRGKGISGDVKKELEFGLELLSIQEYYAKTTNRNLLSGRFFFRYHLLKRFKDKYESLPRKYNFFMNLISLANSIHNEYRSIRNLRKEQSMSISIDELGIKKVPYFSSKNLDRILSNIRSIAVKYLQTEPLYANFLDLKAKCIYNLNPPWNPGWKGELTKGKILKMKKVEEVIKRLFPKDENLLFHSTPFWRVEEIVKDNGISSKNEKTNIDRGEIQGETAAGCTGISFDINYPAHFGFGLELYKQYDHPPQTNWATFIFPMRRALKEGYVLSLAREGEPYEILLRNPHIAHEKAVGQNLGATIRKEIPIYTGYCKKIYQIFLKKDILDEFEKSLRNRNREEEQKRFRSFLGVDSKTSDKTTRMFEQMSEKERKKLFGRFKAAEFIILKTFKKCRENFISFLWFFSPKAECLTIWEKPHPVKYCCKNVAETMKEFLKTKYNINLPELGINEAEELKYFPEVIRGAISKRRSISVNLEVAINNCGIELKDIVQMDMEEIEKVLTKIIPQIMDKMDEMKNSKYGFLETKVLLNDCIAVIASKRFEDAERLFRATGKRPKVVLYSQVSEDVNGINDKEFVDKFLKHFLRIFEIKPSLHFLSDSEYKTLMKGKCFVGTKYDFEGNCTEFKLVELKEVEKD